MPTLTIELPENVREGLEEMSRAEGIAIDELVADWVKREVAVRRFRELQSRMVPHAKAAGFKSDEDFFKAIS